MITVQTLAIGAPIMALITVGVYAAFEYVRIERARVAEIGKQSAGPSHGVCARVDQRGDVSGASAIVGGPVF